MYHKILLSVASWYSSRNGSEQREVVSASMPYLSKLIERNVTLAREIARSGDFVGCAIAAI